MPKDKLEPEYLTRSDVACILKISTKQAGRLMDEMPCVHVGASHKRVSKKDFLEWVERKKLLSGLSKAEPEQPRPRLYSSTMYHLDEADRRFLREMERDPLIKRKPRPLPPLKPK